MYIRMVQKDFWSGRGSTWTSQENTEKILRAMNSRKGTVLLNPTGTWNNEIKSAVKKKIDHKKIRVSKRKIEETSAPLEAATAQSKDEVTEENEVGKRASFAKLIVYYEVASLFKKKRLYPQCS